MMNRGAEGGSKGPGAGQIVDDDLDIGRHRGFLGRLANQRAGLVAAAQGLAYDVAADAAGCSARHTGELGHLLLLLEFCLVLPDARSRTAFVVTARRAPSREQHAGTL